MQSTVRRTARLGDLIAAVFDGAAEYSKDPREVSRLAARAVRHLLGGRRSSRTRPLTDPRLLVIS